jgi:hypothetical protein
VAPDGRGLVEERQGLVEPALSPAERSFKVEQSSRVEHPAGVGS